MSAVWLILTTLLCLVSTAKSASEQGGVINKLPGKDITIQCSTSAKNQEFLELRKGLHQDFQVLYHDGKTKKDTIAKQYHNRLQVHSDFPSVQILIKDLTPDDTGPYWCLYLRFNVLTDSMITTKGNGSVLLVVQGEDEKKTTCKQSTSPTNQDNLIMVSVVISAAVLLSIIMGVLIWLIKSKTEKSTRKPRHVPTSDVYEDMRGTLRR
ncbi:hypothetical protein Q5P01_017442 [Channa striata]|uniref:Immunoglobulin V-set domain-containing protein n=1 Tax=Channa striata TaxID=64152 RepID=A0AA88MA72_CHASR|nr:hypothetical protein Q5P01_017442 [Channa striata]